MGIGYNPSIVTDKLSHCLDAASISSYAGSGNVWKDVITNTSYTVSNMTYSSDNLGSIVFDGSTTQFSLNTPSVTFNNFTVDGWWYPGNQYSRAITPTANGIDNWIGYDNNSQQLQLYYTQSADVNNAAQYSGANTMPINTWSHWAVSLNGANWKIYTNGVLRNSGTAPFTIGSWGSSWTIGHRGNATAWYNGRMAALKIYNKELSTNEILQNFNALRGRFGI